MLDAAAARRGSDMMLKINTGYVNRLGALRPPPPLLAACEKTL